MNDDKIDAVISAYKSLYHEYVRFKRKRDLNIRNVGTKEWKNKLLNFQSVIKDDLKLKVTFTEL